MLVIGFPTGALQANCYVVAPAAGEECVIVDPGRTRPSRSTGAARARLKPVAVLLTHGHIDHTFSVAPVCGARDIPAWIHPDDRDACSTDPVKGVAPRVRPRCSAAAWRCASPTTCASSTDGAELDARRAADLTVDHTPGHTSGSVMFRLPATRRGGAVMFSGDLLFAGSIGRTDLPGGDYRRMLRRLAGVPAAAGRHGGPARPRPVDHDRPRAGTNPFLRTAAGSRRPPRTEDSENEFRRPRASPTTIPPTSAQVLAVRSRRCSRRRACAGYGYIELPVFEDTALFARGVGESTDVGHQGDVHLRRPGGPLADAAPRGHRRRDAGRARARPAPAASCR